MDYKTMRLDDIIEWCKVNNQVAWLKAEAAKKVPTKVYPRKRNEDGKSVVDKTAEPTTEMRPITFIQLKNTFCKQFMPELLPKGTNGEPKQSMWDKIAAL